MPVTRVAGIGKRTRCALDAPGHVPGKENALKLYPTLLAACRSVTDRQGPYHLKRAQPYAGRERLRLFFVIRSRPKYGWHVIITRYARGWHVST